MNNPLAVAVKAHDRLVDRLCKVVDAVGKGATDVEQGKLYTRAEDLVAQARLGGPANRRILDEMWKNFLASRPLGSVRRELRASKRR